MIQASVVQASYLPGEILGLTLRFDSATTDLHSISNISVDLHRLDRERNQLVFGFGAVPTIEVSSIVISQALPVDLRCGLYLINCAVLVFGNSPGAEQRRVAFKPTIFAVRATSEEPYSAKELVFRIDEIERLRSEYAHRVIKTELAEARASNARFRVTIFGVGCLLHTRQQLEGYSISPIGRGLSHRRMHDIVNTVLQSEGTGPIEFDLQAEAHFEKTTPTFMVSFESVDAIHKEDALDHCRLHTNHVFQILGLEHGQMPREFAALVLKYGSPEYLLSFQMPGYRGNLISDFDPVSTANKIERLLPKLKSTPFLRLLAKTFADATAETDRGFSLLRYWAVLELLAKKHVEKGQCIRHPDRKLILKANGDPETTTSTRCRVYAYILANNTFRTHGVLRR